MIIIASLKDIICTGVIRCLNKVYASEFIGKLTGNADTATSATKATQDESGNNIKASYASSIGISDHTITLKNKNGESLGSVTVPDNNTWRGIQNNLTSDSTTDSLSAAQGKVLKGLVDGKANASHGTHVPSTCIDITDWNSATTTGWYMGYNASNAPSTATWYFGYVIAHNTNYVVQEVYNFVASTDAKAIPKYIRAKTIGTWGSWTDVTVQKKVPSDAVFTDTWRPLGTTADTACAGNDSRLSNARAANGSGYVSELVGVQSNNTPYSYTEGNIIRAVWNTKSDNRWYLKAGDYGCRVSCADNADSVSWSNVSGKPSSMPASDVYSWAKASTKPSYSYSEVGAAASSHTHNILSNLYSSRPTSANLTATGSGGLSTFKASSSMTTGKGNGDGHILNFYWDNTDGWDSQLFVPNSNSRDMQYRAMQSGTWQSWKTILDSSNYDNYVKSSPIFKTKSYTITVGVLSAGDAKYDQTYYIGILKGYTPAVISGFYLTGANYTKCTITKIALSGSNSSNSVLWSVQNLGNASTGELTLTVNVLYIRTTNISS